MDKTPTSAVVPRPGLGLRTSSSEHNTRGARLEALKNARNPDGLQSDRSRPSNKLPDFTDRQRSRSRNYDIFLPKQSHIHTPKRQPICTNPDRITRSASPTRVLLTRSESGAQNYRTSLSAVSNTSRDELNSSSNTLNSSNDAISIHSDSPFRKRFDFAYRSLPHGRTSDRFKTVDLKAGQILRDYHRDKERARLELYDITTGKQRHFGAKDDDKTPTAVNGHLPGEGRLHVTFDSATTPSTASSCGSPASQEKLRTPVIEISDVNGNQQQGNGDVIMENGVPLQGGKPLITAEYYCVKRVNYEELKEKFGNEQSPEAEEKTDEAVKKLNLLSVNGEKEKKSIASSISNFFRKMSPRLNRRSRGSEKSSNSSMADEDTSSQDSPGNANKPKSRSMKSPISSPIRRLINGRKNSENESKSENRNNSETPKKPKTEVVKKELEVSKSLPPCTLNVEGRTSGVELKKRGLLSTRSNDSIGECSLDVNMTGSDPSLASCHQSCSVSKRTLHSTEPTKTFSNPDMVNADTVNKNLPVADPHQLSYLGLSVSVGGYPKYRSYSNKAANQDERKQTSDSTDDGTDLPNDGVDDVLNANKPINSSTVHQKTDIPDQKTDYQNGHLNSKNSAGLEDEVFQVSGGKCSTTAVEQVFKTPERPSLRVAINGKATVFGDGEIEITSPVDVSTRIKELRRGSVAKGGQFYLARVAEETARFHHLVSLAEADLEQPGKTEEVYGKLRAAVGKANLLVSQKFKQFIGLCEDNLKPKQEGDLVTNEDLAGFWDMMSLQVEDVDAAFAEIEKMRDNNWKEVQPPVFRTLSSSSQKESTPEKPKRAPKKPNNAADKKVREQKSRDQKSRDEARKRLMEAKRLAMRKRLTSGGSVDDVEIFIAESDNKPSK